MSEGLGGSSLLGSCFLACEAGVKPLAPIACSFLWHQNSRGCGEDSRMLSPIQRAGIGVLTGGVLTVCFYFLFLLYVFIVP